MSDLTRGIGDNSPPGAAEIVNSTATDLSAWLAEHPVIESEKAAREAKPYIDRAKLVLADMEDERDGLVRPLNEQVKEINEKYKAPRNTLQTVLAELTGRLSVFIRNEEQKRIEAAREAARIAEQAKQRAIQAEAAEREAIESAAAGELGIDTKAVVVEADTKFAEYQRAERQAALAEKETKVKIGGGFSRAISLKTAETLEITDVTATLRAVGLTAEITSVILKAARAYRKLYGKLPPGIISNTERTL